MTSRISSRRSIRAALLAVAVVSACEGGDIGGPEEPDVEFANLLIDVYTPETEARIPRPIYLIAIGDTGWANAFVEVRPGYPADYELEFRSSNPAVFAVDRTGETRATLRGLTAGTTSLMLAVEDTVVSAMIQVVPEYPPLESLYIDVIGGAVERDGVWRDEQGNEHQVGRLVSVEIAVNQSIGLDVRAHRDGYLVSTPVHVEVETPTVARHHNDCDPQAAGCGDGSLTGLSVGSSTIHVSVRGVTESFELIVH